MTAHNNRVIVFIPFNPAVGVQIHLPEETVRFLFVSKLNPVIFVFMIQQVHLLSDKGYRTFIQMFVKDNGPVPVDFPSGSLSEVVF